MHSWHQCRWMNAFACLMSGNWYSTQAAGRCSTATAGNDDDACWWKLHSPEQGTRVVNASCADGEWNTSTARKPCQLSLGVCDHCAGQVIGSMAFAGRVVAAVRSRHPSCWAGCPVAEQENATAPCPVHCLFNIILGNASMGLKPMTKEELIAPFEAAFAPEQQGGCPDPTQ